MYSLVQIVRFRIPKTNYYIGAGLLQITGVSFANLASAQAIIKNMYKSGTCPTEIAADGTMTYLPCPDAFGAILGTQVHKKKKKQTFIQKSKVSNLSTYIR